MSASVFKLSVGCVALGFAVFFLAYVLPEVLSLGSISGAFGAGFVNPFATGYSVDVVLCWVIVSLWIMYERSALGVRLGWICLPLGLVPGVATGFGAYLILRTRQLNSLEAFDAH